jgi:sugar/nucleoside kinase (ribokinase family)
MEQPGGQVATALLAANRLGLRARLLGSVGDDAAGGCALAPLRDAGIDLDGVRTVAGAPTRSALVLVDARDGERSVLGFRHPALDLSPTPSDRAAVRDARVLLVDASDPDAAHWAVGVAREKGAPSVLDVDAADPQRLALARSVDFPIVSREFSEQLSGGSSEMETLRCLAGSPVRMATVTRGPAGAIALLEAQVIAQPGFPVEVRDSTGAGDVFRGAFVWGLSRGGDARQVLAWSAAAASLSCRGFGAQGALPTAAEVERRVAAGAGSSAD